MHAAIWMAGARLLSLAFVALMALACSDSAGEPARPPTLPAAAFWLGGPDGGVFVQVSGPGTTGAYAGSIYHPDGSLWYRGPLTLRPAGGKPVDTANRQQFSGWDGTQLLLRDGRALVAGPDRKPKRTGHRARG